MTPTDLQFAVLTALVGTRLHGYALMKAAESVLDRPVATATAYACFETCIERGWMEPDGDEIVNGRARRYYRATSSGSETLGRRARELARQARVAQTRLRSASAGGTVLA